MADQVNPTGSLASGLPLTLLMATTPSQTPGKPRPAKPADSPSARVSDGPSASNGLSPEAAVGELEAYFQQASSDLVFKVEKDTGRTYFKVIDARTNEVILQVPSEEILAMARKLRELANPKGASGVLVDKEG